MDPSSPVHPPRGTYTAVFASSLATLGFEVLLTRIFSITLWYHFAFMVVSIAMLGIALSGTLLAVRSPERARRPPLRGWLFLLLGWSMLGCYLVSVRIPFDPVRLSWDPLQILYISLFYVALVPPFAIFGYIVASSLTRYGAVAGRIYGADLSGAAAGVASIVLVQHAVSPGQGVLLLAMVPLFGALVVSSGTVRFLSMLTSVGMLLCALVHPGWVDAPISPYKELPRMMRYSGASNIAIFHGPGARVDLFRSPAVRHAPGLSLSYTDPVSEQIGLAVDGGSVSAISNVQTGFDNRLLDYLPSAAPYMVRPPRRVLLVNPREGLPLLLARHHGAEVLDQIEENPTVSHVLNQTSALGERPDDVRGETQVGIAQCVLRNDTSRYDLIHVSLAGTVTTAGTGGFEDYRFTREAITTYLDHLGESGVLSIDLYTLPPYRTEFRMLATIASVLEELGTNSPGTHVAAIRSIETLSLLVSPAPFRPEELAALGEFAHERWFEVVWPPSDREAGTVASAVEDPMRTAFTAILSPRNVREEFIRDYVFDIEPVTNDRPFFFDHIRLSRIRDAFNLVGGKWEFFVHEGYLTPFILGQVLLVGIVLVIVPAWVSSRKALTGELPRVPVLGYFGLLGLGYMFVEIAIVQNLILVLENPTQALALTLGTLLVSSGLGSMMSSRLPAHRLPLVVLGAAVVALGGMLVLGPFGETVLGRPLAVRVLLALLLVAPAGFAMGMPFPLAVRLLSADHRHLVPWAWALNGFFSVLAPVLAILVAVKTGFSSVLGLGAVAYFGASVLSRRFCTSPTIGTKATGPI